MGIRHKVEPEELTGGRGSVPVGGVPGRNQEVSRLEGSFFRAFQLESRGKREEQEMIFRVSPLNRISGGQGADAGQTDRMILIK